jgi:hypothetical protein
MWLVRASWRSTWSSRVSQSSGHEGHGLLDARHVDLDDRAVLGVEDRTDVRGLVALGPHVDPEEAAALA